jgi:hypothetical protein
MNMKLIENNAKMAACLALSFGLLTVVLTKQSADVKASQYEEVNSVVQADAQSELNKKELSQTKEPTWRLYQPNIGTFINDDSDVKEFLYLYIDGSDAPVDPKGIMWLQMAIDDPTILKDSENTAVTKREFAHGLNMPWKVVGNF